MASAFKCGCEPDLYNTQRHIFRHHSFTKGKNICIVMLARKPGRIFIPTQCAPDAMYLIGYHCFPVTGSAEHNATLKFTPCDSLCGRTNKVGIIHRSRAIGAEVFYLMARRIQPLDNGTLIVKTSMVAGNSNLHWVWMLISAGRIEPALGKTNIGP